MVAVVLNSLGLLALTFPTHLEQPLMTLQKRLFREFGLASALALEPLIPILWTDSPLPLAVLREIAGDSRLFLELTGKLPFFEAGTLWLPVDMRAEKARTATAGAFASLRASAMDAANMADTESSSRGLCPSPPFSDTVGAIRLSEAEDDNETMVKVKESRASVSRPEEGGPAGTGALSLASLFLSWESERPWWSRSGRALAASVRLRG